MPIVIADRVKVTTTTTGTGTLTLGAAATGFQDFGVIGDGNETYYTISVPGGADFEVGIGTFTASGTTLSRDTILASSNGGLAVNLSAGTKDVFVTYPSGRSVVSYDGNNSEFPPTTRMIFAQTTAPTGWTKDTTNFNQHALRVVTGTTSPGGTVDFTTAFASQTPTGNVSVSASTGQIAQGGNVSSSTGQAAGPVSVGDTTLSTPVIPAHQHKILSGFNTTRAFSPNSTEPGVSLPNIGTGSRPANTANTGGGGAHSHPGSGGQHSHPASSTFTGSQHDHPVTASGTFTGSAINLAVRYVDVITATKD